MSKYSFELKQKVVQEYLKGKQGYRSIAIKYHIPAHSTVEKWINNYNAFGDDGLKKCQKPKTYSFDFKLHVVELYLTTEVSYQDLALAVGINNPAILIRWVNDFKFAGPDALRSKRKGGRSIVSNQEEIKQAKNTHTDSQYLKKLEDENLKLRIENAYLKELRRLRLEGTPQNKKRESSTASEDPSN
jgi:transposase